MEISLPDESGRFQILKIHTAKMRDNKVLDLDVDLKELSQLTKNFSGAEISGMASLYPIIYKTERELILILTLALHLDRTHQIGLVVCVQPPR